MEEHEASIRSDSGSGFLHSISVSFVVLNIRYVTGGNSLGTLHLHRANQNGGSWRMDRYGRRSSGNPYISEAM